MATPMIVMTSDPAMALRRPPLLPGGGVISVKTAGDSPRTPS